MNRKPLLLGIIAAAGLALPAGADLPVANSGFEPPIYNIGTLVGQNGWSIDAPWVNVNGATVTNVGPVIGMQSVKFDGPDAEDSCNFTLPLSFDPTRGMDTIRVQAKMFVEPPAVPGDQSLGHRAALRGGVPLAWVGINGPTGEIVIQTNNRFPTYTGFTVPFDGWNIITLSVDMWGNYATVTVNGARLYSEPITPGHAPGIGFLQVMVDSPKGEAMYLDDVVVTGLCRADFNADGLVSVQDIFSFLEMWFDGDFAADIDHSAHVNVGDVFEFLAAWFAGCA